MDEQNTRTETTEATLVVEDPPIRISVPLQTPEVLRKPSQSSKRGSRGKKRVKSVAPMGKKEIMSYCEKLQKDPNFSILPFPQFVVDSNPQLYANVDEQKYKEDMRRLEYVIELDNAKTPAERQAIIDKRKKEVGNQIVPHYSGIVRSTPVSFKG